MGCRLFAYIPFFALRSNSSNKALKKVKVRQRALTQGLNNTNGIRLMELRKVYNP